MLKNKNYNALLHVWLIVLTILIALIIVVGGLTRLTNSGLSITEWELFKGVIPPTSSDEWLKYFNSYKEIPQYKLINNKMSFSLIKQSALIFKI
jgi:cytochrome c oxidase assembly protein subunit 15